MRVRASATAPASAIRLNQLEAAPSRQCCDVTPSNSGDRHGCPASADPITVCYGKRFAQPRAWPGPVRHMSVASELIELAIVTTVIRIFGSNV